MLKQRNGVFIGRGGEESLMFFRSVLKTHPALLVVLLMIIVRVEDTC